VIVCEAEDEFQIDSHCNKHTGIWFFGKMNLNLKNELGLCCLILSVFLVTPAGTIAGEPAAGTSVVHDIQIELFPEEMKLVGRDLIRIKNPATDILQFRIAKKLGRIGVDVDGNLRDVDIDGDQLRLKLKKEERTADLSIRFVYTGIFDDPAPVQPVNTDNPGYGVTGTISPRGTFLLAGAGWYPELMNSQAIYRVAVTAPAGLIAVTAGRSLGHVTENGKTLSTWEVDYPVRGLALSAARYVVEEKLVGKVTAATYLLPQHQHLAASYLSAIAGYLNLYSDLFGPYPFQKFAVVENFFPTGFGFPSYTLMGGSVLRLPFIVHTSLGHEIAHCWWGNGVYVDYASGNWSEGLTTYVADYLYKEMKSEKEALDARRQWLKNYATLIRPENDFALSQFRSRYSPATKTIGYDKCAMVFHMIRQLIGEEAFWGSLRDLYQNRRFRPTSWADIQRAFESRSKRSLHNLFGQWVYRKGAPQFSIDVATTKRSGQNWQITGEVTQENPIYQFPLDLRVETDGQIIEETIDVAGRVTAFELASPKMPKKLIADPRADLFRRLSPSEIPPSVNSLKGATSVEIVLTEPKDPDLTRVAKTLIMSLGLKSYQMVSARELKQHKSGQSDILVVGQPPPGGLFERLPTGFGIRQNSFSIDGATFDKPTDAFFGVFDHPDAAQGIVALYMPLSADYAEIVAAKITHYGRYSYLAFQKGKNKAKGFWPVDTSPLIYRWRGTD
jgi:hypothetical protein